MYRYRAICFAVAMTFFVVFGFSDNLHAAPLWYKVTVKQAGPNTDAGDYEVRFLVVIGTKTRWLKAAPGHEKEMLAVALSSIATGKQVRVFTDLLVTPIPIIKNMYIFIP